MLILQDLMNALIIDEIVKQMKSEKYFRTLGEASGYKVHIHFTY